MRKVTVGFKCHPGLKQSLLRSSQQSGISLSEYVENICESLENEGSEYSDLYEQLQELQSEASWLRNELSEYESELLGPLFEEYEGQTLNVRLSDGQVSELYIETPKDLLKAILYSLENKQ